MTVTSPEETQSGVLNKQGGHIMKKFIEVLTSEEKSFEAPGWVFAVVMPVALIVLLGLAGWMDTHGM